MTTEFDHYAATYDGGQRDSWLKRLLGSERDFCAVKVRWLAYRLPRWPLRVLDYGCGTGEWLKLWQEVRPNDSLAGHDPSEGMLRKAALRFVHEPGSRFPDFRAHTTWNDETFDLVVVTDVLHHVPTDRRDMLLRDAFVLLKPGGELVIFEHNARNPLVRWVVQNTEIDRNASLLRNEETRVRVAIAGFRNDKSEFLMFFPPSWRVSAWVERLLRWLPLGGQYAVTARRPE